MTETDKVLIDYLQERSSLLVLQCDPEGVVVSANSYARSLVGESCIGTPLGNLLVNFNNSFDLSELWNEPGVPRLLNFSTAAGIPETLQVTFFTGDNGGIIIGEHDVVELQEFRTSVLDLNQSLSNLSRELQKKNVELQKLNDLKNQFLGMAAHDLRNPISTIITYTDLYLDDESTLPSDMVEVLGDIRTLSDFMLHMIVQLLDISVIEMGKLVLDEQLLEVVPFANEVVRLNSLLAQKKGIVLEQHYSGDLDRVRCDRHKLKQVMNNLISNAIKFSHHGTVVSIAVFGRGGEMRVEVRDQGVGIPDHEQERLFKPVGRSSVRATGGEISTGLGLAISRRIVESHGGAIGVKSSPGSGSTFCFTIPLRA
jgi:signal transduction histidine kinase